MWVSQRRDVLVLLSKQYWGKVDQQVTDNTWIHVGMHTGQGNQSENNQPLVPEDELYGKTFSNSYEPLCSKSMTK